MPSPTLTSPNTGNLRVGKGRCEFLKDGEVEWRHMGNSPSFEYTPTVEKLDHFSSMEGVKTKDVSAVLTQSGTIAITLEEWTPDNVSLMVMGDVDEAAVGGPTIDIMSRENITGQLRFISTNEIGPKWNWTFYNVSFSPSSSLQGISEDWGQMELTAEVLVSQTSPNVGKVGIAQCTNIDS